MNANVNQFDEEKFNSNRKWKAINLDASIKDIIFVKKNILGILIHVVVKMENIYKKLLTIQ